MMAQKMQQGSDAYLLITVCIERSVHVIRLETCIMFSAAALGRTEHIELFADSLACT